MTNGRSFAAGKFALELDGQNAGWVQNVTGGAAHSEVITEALGQKHVGPVRYEDIVLTCGPGMSKAFYDWVYYASYVAGGHPRKNGAILTCDYKNKLLGRLEFMQALITEINFPALDATSKEKVAITIKISPEYTRRKSGDGSFVKSALPKASLTSNFRLRIDGLEEACKWVTRIGRISITQTVVEDPVGDSRVYEVPGRLSLSDLIITLPESRAGKFYDWFEDFVIKGNNSADREKNGNLDFLATNLSGLFSLSFSHLGIYRITDFSNLPGAEIRKVTANMYCEEIGFRASGVIMS